LTRLSPWRFPPKIAAWKGSDDMETRAQRANLEAFDRVMAKIPNVPPLPGDELPPGCQRG